MITVEEEKKRTITTAENEKTKRIVSVRLTEDEFTELSQRLGDRSCSDFLREIVQQELQRTKREDESERRFKELAEKMQKNHQEVLVRFFWLKAFVEEHAMATIEEETWKEIFVQADGALADYKKDRGIGAGKEGEKNDNIDVAKEASGS